MKKFTYILMFLVLGITSSCTKEPAIHDNNNSDVDGTAIISVTTKNMLPVNMNTKANATNISQLLATVKDLNVRVHKKDNTHTDFFCKGNTLTQDGNATNKSYYIGNQHLVNFTVDSYVKIHTDILASIVDYIEVIANYGSDLRNTADWTTVKEVGETNLGLRPEPICMMYGKTNTASEVSHMNGKDGKPIVCKNYEIALKRSRAMITVKMTDGGLNPGITITPQKIRLHNVPVECTLANLRPDFSTSVSGTNKIAALDKSAVFTQEYKFELPKGLSGDVAGEASPTGDHADQNKGILPTNFLPFYMYENMQGVHTNTTGKHKDKNPGNFTVADLKNRNKVYQYSYIEIEADFEQMTADASGNRYVKVAGPIIYRFFLGENATDNFDVEGNHYYKLTLNLKGYGGAAEDGKVDKDGNLVVNQEDLSWRVDMETRDWGFEKDQYDFDSHLYRGTAKVVGNNWAIQSVIGGNEGTASWLTFNTKKPYGGYMYANPTAAMTAELNIVDGRLNFWVQPLLYGKGVGIDPAGYFDENTYKQEKCYREFIITVKNLDNKKTQKVTVRQYCPIPITKGGETIFIERFEEYDPKNIGFPWKWAGDNLTALEARASGYAENDMFTDPNQLPPLTTQSFLYKDKVTYDKRVITENTRYLSGVVQGYKEWAGTYPNMYQIATAKLIANAKGEGSAADMCYRKSHDGERGGNVQGFWAWYYALPDSAWMVEIMKYRHVKADGTPQYGPFEPIHERDDYWLLDVKSTDPLQTAYYDGSLGKVVYTKNTNERNLNKRVRSIYTNTGQFNQGAH